MRSAQAGVFAVAVPRAEGVVLVALLAFEASRHLGGVEAEAVRLHERGVEEALRDHHVGHRRHHRGVRSGPDGDPLVGQGHRARRHPRVDAHDASAPVARGPEEVLRVRAVAHLAGVPSPHEDVLRVHPVLALIAGDVRAVDGLGRSRHRRPRVVVVVPQRAAEEVHQALGRLAAVRLAVAAGAVRHEERRVAVLRLHAGQLGRHAIERFGPRDPCEPPLATPAHALERVQQTVRMVLALTIGAASGAGAKQRGLEGVGRTVVGLDADDHAIANVEFEETAATAIVGGAAGANDAQAWRGGLAG